MTGRFTEILFILVVIMILFGTKRLPEIGSSLGKAIREFQKAVKGEHDEKDQQEHKS